MRKIFIPLLDTFVFGLFFLSLAGRFFHLYPLDIFRAFVIAACLLFFFAQESRVTTLLKCMGETLERSKPARISLTVMVTLLAIAVCVMQALAFFYPIYDVGIFHQILYSIQNGEGFHSTLSKAGDFLQDHFSPSLALLSPLFSITHSHPLTLITITPLLIFGGSLSWVWFSRKHLSKQTHLPALVLALFLASFWMNFAWGFHEDTLGFFCLNWGLALFSSAFLLNESFFSKQNIISLVFLFSAAFSKETLALGILFFFFLNAGSAFFKKQRKAFFYVFAGALLLVFLLHFESQPKPSDKNYFIRYYAYLGNNPRDALLHFLAHPFSFVHAIGIKEEVIFLKTLFLPFLFLPLFGLFLKRKMDEKSFSLYVMLFLSILPAFLLSFLSTYPALREARYHYVLELWPALALCSLIALSHLDNRKIPALLIALTFFLFPRDVISEIREFADQAASLASFRNAVSEIPEKDSVWSAERLGTWIASRSQVYRLDDLSEVKPPCPEWIILRPDETLSAFARVCISDFDTPHFNSNKWKIHRGKNNRLKQNPRPR